MLLSSDFYRRDVLVVAKELLGMHLVRIIEGRRLVCRIVETEAYWGPEDKGCHAYNNRRTGRTEVMFRPGGCAYIYLIYGMYNMLNIVTAEAGQPQAVLIRAGEPLAGIDLMQARRPKAANRCQLLNGPGKLCQALAIDMSFNGCDLTAGEELFIERPDSAAREPVAAGKRINIDYAGEWAEKPWRFYFKGNPYVSIPD
ncbi:MAG TPA: DNA-3-methyladenine glycosylase [Limnochordia bacterium]|nr:DNA-3-methyladenine glycosylase [Limnochordia bacterium]